MSSIESQPRETQSREGEPKSDKPTSGAKGDVPDSMSRARKRRFRIRFRLLDLMWLSLLTAILILWYKDHVELTNQLASINSSPQWGVRQVLGKPNTLSGGDYSTAWASAMQDAGMEWLIVEFPRAVMATQLQIEETYNPGSVVRVCSVDFRHSETTLWKGKDPTPVTVAKGTSMIVFDQPISSRRFKIYLDSDAVPGWNEIDAVGLHGKDGAVQWASNAWASTCFGTNQPLPKFFWP